MSQRNSGYDRQRLDRYETEPWAVFALLHVWRPPRIVSEPACGSGKMVRALEQAGHTVIASDIEPAFEGAAKLDFLSLEAAPADTIITNPPFGTQGKLAEKFIAQALAVTKAERGRVAMLLPSQFDHASGRVDLFRDHPAFERRVMLTSRIVWFVEPGKKKPAPSENHAWFVWDWFHKGAPRVQYVGLADLPPEQRVRHEKLRKERPQ